MHFLAVRHRGRRFSVTHLLVLIVWTAVRTHVFLDKRPVWYVRVHKHFNRGTQELLSIVFLRSQTGEATKYSQVKKVVKKRHFLDSHRNYIAPIFFCVLTFLGVWLRVLFCCCLT